MGALVFCVISKADVAHKQKSSNVSSYQGLNGGTGEQRARMRATSTGQATALCVMAVAAAVSSFEQWLRPITVRQPQCFARHTISGHSCSRAASVGGAFVSDCTTTRARLCTSKHAQSIGSTVSSSGIDQRSILPSSD